VAYQRRKSGVGVGWIGVGVGFLFAAATVGAVMLNVSAKATNVTRIAVKRTIGGRVIIVSLH
jgi:hypothetical protein